MSSTPATQTQHTHPRLVPIAPAAVDTTTTASPSQPDTVEEDVPHMPFTCVTCARRKVKCDKTGPPCGTCKKARLSECIYEEPRPRKRKRRPVDDLHDRLEKYEQLLKDNGILPKEFEASPEATPATLAPTDRPSSPHGTKRIGTLLKGSGGGKTRYIDSNLWRNLSSDLPNSDDEEGEFDESSYSAPASAEPLDPASAAFFSPSTPGQSLLNVHPTYDVAMKLWKTYAQNVDPVIKICHVPTTLELVQRAATNPSAMSKVTECLVFAIYHFAVASMSERECQNVLGCSKAPLSKQYHSAARQALVACHFLRTTELQVLQAYMLFLLSVRNDYDPHTFWILTGIAVRIAQRMGLHRDGEALGLNAFDVQMRRRVFWQLLPLDGLSAQISGTGIAISPDSWDTKQPLNINDEDIWPGMTTAPMAKKGATDMIFCLARSEIGRFHQKVKPAMGNWSKLWEVKDTPQIKESLQELENTMEEKYIRYCDISNPVHCLTMGMARGSVTVARLRIRLPRALADDATAGERKELYGLAMKVLDHAAATHMNQALHRYNWHLKAFFQWDPLIWLLRETRRDDCIADPDVIWSKVEQIFTTYPEMITSKRSIDVAMARLTLRTWDAHLAKPDSPAAGEEPAYIQELRAAFGRREASRQNTETPQADLPAAPYDPRLDIDAASPPPVSAGGGGSGGGGGYLPGNGAWEYGDYSIVENMGSQWGNAEAANQMDWMFWDQLMRDPSAFQQM